MIEVESYLVCVGHELEHAKACRYADFRQAIRAASRKWCGAGYIWAAPVTRYGIGRWVRVGEYDGHGRVYAGAGEEVPATPETLLWVLRRLT